jgi:hypothetical protein
MLHTDLVSYHPTQTLLTTPVVTNPMISNHFQTQSYFSNDPARFYSSSSNIVHQSNHFLPSYHRTQSRLPSNRVYVPVVMPSAVHSSQPIPMRVTRLKQNSARSCSFPPPRPKTSQKTILELLESPMLEERQTKRSVCNSTHKRRSFNAEPLGPISKTHQRKNRMTYV